MSRTGVQTLSESKGIPLSFPTEQKASFSGGVGNFGVGNFGGGGGAVVPQTDIVTQVVNTNLIELKRNDIAESNPYANTNLQEMKQPLLEKQKRVVDEIQDATAAQAINASKVLSRPGTHLYDAPLRTEFIRNNFGDVVKKEFFIDEVYLKDALVVREEVKEETKCVTIRYTLIVEGAMIDGPPPYEDLWNWKLGYNYYNMIIVVGSILGTLILTWGFEDKLAYLGFIGLILSLFILLCVFYFRSNGLEKRINEKTKNLFTGWRNSLERYGNYPIPQDKYNKRENSLLFLEIVERTVTQKQLHGIVQQEKDGLYKSGFGRTIYAVCRKEEHFDRWDKNKPGWLVPILLFAGQFVALFFSVNKLENMDIV